MHGPYFSAGCWDGAGEEAMPSVSWLKQLGGLSSSDRAND
jgi:hypothetical protein